MAGDAIDDFIALPQDQQLSTLQQLAPDKQDALLSQVKQRRSAKPTITATPDNRNFIQRGMDNFTTVLPGDEQGHGPAFNFMQNLGASAVGTLTAPLIHPVQTLHSILPERDPNTHKLTPTGWGETALGPAGPMIVNTVKSIYNTVRNQPAASAAGSLVGQGVGGALLGEGTGAVMRGGRAVLRNGLTTLAGTEPIAAQTIDKIGAANADATAAAAKATQANAEKAAAQTKVNQERAATINANKATQHQTQVQAALEKTNAAQAEAQAQQDAYAKQAQDHADAVAKADEINKAAAEDQTLHGQLARKSVQLAQRMVERVRQVAANTKAGLDQSYAEIRQTTGAQTDPETGAVIRPAVTVPREQLASAVEKAQTKLKGSTESIKQFKDILSKAPEEESPDSISYQGAQIPQGHPLYDVLNEMGKEGTPGAPPAEFGDLQGYYTELGEKLSGGNLLPDVYQAMRSLQTDIASMMQKMAAERGVGAKLSATRAHYRDYMQSFKESAGPNHSGSPLAQVLDAADPTYAVKPLTAPETAARVRTMLSRFDPAVNGVGGAGQLYDNFRNTMNQYENSGKLKPAKPVGEPPVAPPPAPEPAFIPDRPQPIQAKTVQGEVVKPEITKVGPETIQQAKADQVVKSAQNIHDQATRYGLRSFLYGLPVNITTALLGHPLAAIGEMGVPTAITGGGHVLAGVLSDPRIINVLSKPTAAELGQLEKIPPEQRTAAAQQLKPLIEAARRQGVQVHPAIMALFGLAQPVANQFPMRYQQKEIVPAVPATGQQSVTLPVTHPLHR